MIRLLEARFSNYRGLRDVDITFASEGERALTVIRAENATGKTSVLYGLTWCLFGDAGLPVSPRRRTDYRLSPIDWDIERDGSIVDVQVTIRLRQGDGSAAQEYEVIRSARETLNGASFEVTGPTRVQVFRITAEGAKPLDAPETFLTVDLMPLALKDVFFLDGDEALKDYVESARDETRQNVREAVRNLLGLEILEAAQNHLDDLRRSINAEISRESTGELKVVTDRVTRLDQDIAQFEQERLVLEDNVKACEQRKDQAKRTRDEVLAAGGRDHHDLQAKERAEERGLRQARADVDALIKRQRGLLSSDDILTAVATDAVRCANEIYDSLRRERKIPNTVPELVQERLTQGTCICGASLASGTTGHTHLVQELQESKRYDSVHRTLTNLAQAAQTALVNATMGDRNWFAQADDNIRSWHRTTKLIEEKEASLAEVRTRIKAVANGGDFLTADSALTTAETNLEQARRELRGKESHLALAGKEREDLRKKAESLGRKEKKFRKRQAEQQAVLDMLQVIKGTVGVLQNETVAVVGERTNEIFQDLLAAAPAEVGAALDTVVQGVELTPACDIKVFGPMGREIHTANGLSGAQRRALTVAFILALTKVSGVSAPLVIDTPLGMTSGVIRRALLENTLKNSGQVILFLTRAEIEGVEDILDRYTDVAHTMTNTQHRAHAANELEGRVGRAEVLLCRCDHTSTCATCARKED